MLLPQSLLEADTRVILLTLAGWVVLAAISVQAAPLPSSKATLDELTAPPIEPVARIALMRGIAADHARDTTQ
jgi:hypothetical protein